MKGGSMKRIRLVVAVAAVLLCGCATRKKVTNHYAESAQSSLNVGFSVEHQGMVAGRLTVAEGLQEVTERDSTVEKYREKVVMDSAGRVLLHEKEHERERHHVNGRAEQSKDHEGEGLVVQTGERTALEDVHGAYDGKSEEDVVKKAPSQTMMWYMLGVSLVVICVVIFESVKGWRGR